MTTTADTLYALGKWLIEQKRATDAVHVFRTMLTQAPADERSWLGLGQTHESLGDDEIAAGLYQLGEKAVPTSFRCSLAYARLLRRRERGCADVVFERAEERARNHEDEAVAAAIAFERVAA